MLHASTQKLIIKLCDLTERGEAPWREGEDGACWFETEGYRIEVKPEPPIVRVLQAGGREVESADAALLASAPFPGQPGTTFADRVKRMGLDAGRIARGAETAISTILSALSSPPAKTPEPAHFSTEGGPESEAAMAAAVADMALRLRQPPLEASTKPAEPPNVATPLDPAAPSFRSVTPPPPQRNVSTAAMFGAIPSFAGAAPATRPVEPVKLAAPAPAPKTTSSGLVVTGFHAVSVQTPDTGRPPELKRPSSAGYRPWT